ncbi:uncharacterized protein [Palaemon carinicauda]|uniref:uncharacterized protein n=1 Tax=Palaemon carinicauda TaxID=392227 RepID=UPI0035B5C361
MDRQNCQQLNLQDRFLRERNLFLDPEFWGDGVLVLLITFSSATHDSVVKPEFGEKAKDLNITAYVGQTSRLPCTVKHLSGKKVSWIRQRDLQVLPTGRHTFSTDLRISVLPGTRFKLRRPRDLASQGSLQSHVFEGASDSTWYHTIGSQGPRSSSYSQLEYEEEDGSGSFAAMTIYVTEDTIFLNMGELGGRISLRHIFPRYKMDAKRGKRSLHHYNYNYARRKMGPWYKTNLKSSKDYYFSSGWIQKRSKKALPSQNHHGYTKLQSLTELQFTRSRKNDQRETYKKETNPIAIYPQGPIPIASD